MDISFACNRLFKELDVQSGRRQFVLTGNINDCFFVDAATGVCENIEDALLYYGMQKRYEIVVVFDSNMNPRFASPEMERLYSQIVDIATPLPEDRIEWNDDPIETASTKKPDTESAVNQATRGTSTREKIVLEKILNRLIPDKHKSFVVIVNPESLLEYNIGGGLTSEARQRLEMIRGCAKQNPGNIDTCTLLLVGKDHFDCFVEASSGLVGGLESRTKTIHVVGPDVHEIESMLTRIQCRYGLSGNARMIARDVHAKSQRENEELYNIFSTIRRRMVTSRPETLEDLFADGKSDDEKRKILEEAEKELASMIGLAAVKDKVREFKALARLLKENQEAGRESPFNLHALLLGNPGTGKTVVARILGRMYYALGIRSSEKVVEISAADIKSPYNPADAAVNLQKKIKEALGGVLFIDEVYQFAEDEWLRKAFEDELMKYMEDHRDSLTVLAAGYEEKRQVIFNINPGVRRRFNDPDNTIVFPDYSIGELVQIAEGMFAKHGRTLTPRARQKMINYIELRSSIGKMENAGGIRNLVEIMIKNAAIHGRFEEIEDQDIPDIKRGMPIDGVLQELNEKFVGLQSVKDRIMKIARRIEHDERKGILTGQKFNMQFVGNPGTGKTTVARYMSRVFNSVGLIEGEDVIEIAGSALKGSVIGKAQENVRNAFAKARDEGKVLFIDEAYALFRNNVNQDSYGQEVIDTIVSEVTSAQNGRVFTILAGYRDDMEFLMNGNDGLASRFPLIVEFPDYSIEECLEILCLELRRKKKELEPTAAEHVKVHIVGMKRKEKFGNARAMETLASDLIDACLDRDTHSDTITLEDVQRI